MKNFSITLQGIVLACLMSIAINANAQTTTMHIWKNGSVTWSADIQNVDSITFSEKEQPVQPNNDLTSVRFTHATVAYYNSADYLAKLPVVDSVFIYTDNTGVRHALRGYLVDVDVHFYSEGLYLNDNGEMDGATEGYVASFPGKAYYAPEGLNSDRGYEYSAMTPTGIWSTQTKNKEHTMEGGYMTNETEAFEHVKTAFNYANEQNWEMYHQEMFIADTMAFKGGRIQKYTYIANGDYYSTTYFPAAIANACAAKLSYSEDFVYMYKVPAIEMYFNVLGGETINGIEYEMNDITEEMTLKCDKFIVDENSIHIKYTTENAPARRMQDRAIPLTQEDLNAPILPAQQPKNVRFR